MLDSITAQPEQEARQCGESTADQNLMGSAHLFETAEFFAAAAHAHLAPFALFVLGNVHEHPIAVRGTATA